MNVRNLRACRFTGFSDIVREKHKRKGCKEMPDGFQIIAPIIVGYPRSIPDLSERMKPQILKIVSRESSRTNHPPGRGRPRAAAC